MSFVSVHLQGPQGHSLYVGTEPACLPELGAGCSMGGAGKVGGVLLSPGPAPLYSTLLTVHPGPPLNLGL